MTVSTFQQTDFTTQAQNVDSDISVLTRLGDAFAPHETSPLAMKVSLDPGHVFDGTTLTEVAAQTTGLIIAPAADPRIDRVVIDRTTGIASVVTGTEAASPTPPAIPAGKAPVVQIALTPSTTVIDNTIITDERSLNTLGLGTAAVSNTGVANGQVPLMDATGYPAADGSQITNIGGGSGLQSVQVFTASGTWTKPAGITTVITELVGGGGGGGGGSDATDNGGTGGGGGGYSKELIDVSGTSSETVTVGAGGAGGGSGAAGSGGSTSSLGAFLSATGGAGGAAGGTGAGVAGGAGGSGSGGTVNINGGGGGVPHATSTESGTGGESFLSGRTLGKGGGGAGIAGLSFGGGGGGGVNSGNSGGAGAAGVVIVWEYK